MGVRVRVTGVRVDTLALVIFKLLFILLVPHAAHCLLAAGAGSGREIGVTLS